MNNIKYGGKRIGREDTITFEEAKKRFDNFYSNPEKYKTDIGQLRAKMFDAMYQKKKKTKQGNKRNFVCNMTDEYDHELDIAPGECEKGSAKYNLEMGPKTFDIDGIDSFPENEIISINHKGKNINIQSKGSSVYKPKYDKDIASDDIETNNKGQQISNKIYGPRLKANQELYNSYFRKLYNDRIINQDYGTKEDMKSKNIIDIYWDKYRAGELDKDGKPIQRKNKKKTSKILSSEFIDDDDEDDDISDEKDDIDDADDDNEFYPFQEKFGTVYQLNKNGKVYDDKNNLIYENILGSEVSEIVRTAAFEHGLISKVSGSENTFILNLDISDKPDIDIENLENNVYLNTINDEYYIHNLKYNIVYKLNHDLLEDSFEIDYTDKYNSFNDFLEQLDISLVELKKQDIFESDEKKDSVISLPIDTNESLIDSIDFQPIPIDDTLISLDDIKTVESASSTPETVITSPESIKTLDALDNSSDAVPERLESSQSTTSLLSSPSSSRSKSNESLLSDALDSLSVNSPERLESSQSKTDLLNSPTPSREESNVSLLSEALDSPIGSDPKRLESSQSTTSLLNSPTVSRVESFDFEGALGDL